jgi:hypothetical protein
MTLHAVSEARLAANRENAQLSTGPKTEEGKARSSQNARVHGLFSKWMFLEGEDPAEFDALLAGLREDLKPQGYVEETLVHDIARARWRLLRLMGWEWTAHQSKMKEVSRELGCPIEKAGTQAFRLLAEQTEVLPLFLRYESMFDRQISRALDTLRKIQRERKEKKEPEPAEKAPQASVRNEPIPRPSAPPKPAVAAPANHVRGVKKAPRAVRRMTKSPPGDGGKR